MSAFVTVITPIIVSPLIFTAAVKACPVIILSVDATPVRPSPDPTNDVAIIPAPASTPEALIVTAAPTIALPVVVTPVTTAPSGNQVMSPVLPLKLVT